MDSETDVIAIDAALDDAMDEARRLGLSLESWPASIFQNPISFSQLAELADELKVFLGYPTPGRSSEWRSGRDFGLFTAILLLRRSAQSGTP